MKKKFLSNFLLLFFVNLLIKPAWLFADLLVQRNTGEAYGQYFVLFNLSLLFNMLLDFGISNYNNRKIAGNPNQFKAYFSRVATLRLLLSGIYIIVLILYSFLMNYSLFELKCLAILGINQILLSGITYFRSNLTALNYFKWDRFISVIDRVVMSVIILLILFTNKSLVDIALFIKIQFVGYFVAFLAALFFLIKKGASFKLTWNFKFNKTLLLKSYPYALIVILMSAYSYSDSIMLYQMLENGKWENMIYAQSFRVLMAGNNYIYLVAVLLLPTFSKLLKQKKEIQKLLRLSGGVVIYFVSVFVVLAHLYSQEIIGFLYANYSSKVDLITRFNESLAAVNRVEELLYSAKVFSFLILSLIPMSFNYIYGVLLTAGGNMKVLNRIALISLVSNLLMNYLLIPIYGAYGAAIASLLTQSFAAFGQWFFAYKNYRISFPVWHFVKFLTILFFLYISFYHLKSFLTPVQAVIVFLFSSFPLVFLLRIITWENIRTHFLKR